MVRLWLLRPILLMLMSGVGLFGRRVVRLVCGCVLVSIRMGTVWVYHLDHVVTEAAMDAAARAMDDAFRGAERRPFQDLVREEQRSGLRLSVM
jgi:hypothetical protein